MTPATTIKLSCYRQKGKSNKKIFLRTCVDGCTMHEWERSEIGARLTLTGSWIGSLCVTICTSFDPFGTLILSEKSYLRFFRPSYACQTLRMSYVSRTHDINIDFCNKLFCCCTCCFFPTIMTIIAKRYNM